MARLGLQRCCSGTGRARRDRRRLCLLWKQLPSETRLLQDPGLFGQLSHLLLRLLWAVAPSDTWFPEAALACGMLRSVDSHALQTGPASLPHALAL